jgi:hypothetical protein
MVSTNVSEEATCSFEMSVEFERATRRYIPEDIILQTRTRSDVYLTLSLTNSMEENPWCEADSRTACQKLTHTTRNTRAH